MYALRAASLGKELIALAIDTRIKSATANFIAVYKNTTDQKGHYMSSKLELFVTKTKDYLKQESDRLDLLLKRLKEAKAPDVDECLYESDGWTLTWLYKDSTIELRWQWNAGIEVMDVNGKLQAEKKMTDAIRVLLRQFS